ncbi:Two-component response regulator [Planktothrix serta PCC 8927]|uniref:Two-component response regulator n=1 Tax=Planktothrix serta PCC 8927 TaxID=671068 RepID=A0A7Z9BP69_9CYAN|nr:GGDEF domain-containing response regulator [Planktothrix serta]VXD15445.1 Two-component response regulator [Planktothrix serta PCC 8927]
MIEKQPDTSRGNILIIDDNPENLRLLSRMLVRRGYEVRQAINGIIALRAIEIQQPDIILLDIMMPQMDGYEVCKWIKNNPQTTEIPVIFLSALDQVQDKLKGFAAGAADYITKPFQFDEVLVRVQNQLSLQFARKQIVELNTELEQRVKERTQQLEDVHAQLLKKALYDELTALPNRVLFIQRLEATVQELQANPNIQFAVLFLDCDRFKVINDSLGHSVGDQLLIAIAQRLQSSLPNVDILARFGGDEFAILLTNLTQPEIAIEMAEKIIEILSQPFSILSYPIYINASIGVAYSQPDYTRPEQILRDVDTAMYRAKSRGTSCYQVFDSSMYQNALSFLQLDTDLRTAIKEQQFRVNYQPIIALKTGKIVGFEALVCWHHPQRGLVPPGDFIPVAEETGLITEIGYWVLRQAGEQIYHWQQQFTDIPLTISINLTPRQFTQGNLIAQLDEIIRETHLNSRSLKLEIKESAIMDNLKTAQIILNQLRQREIQLSLDDFGTGYSSLSYLHSFPVDTLKIDRSFIQGLDEIPQKLGLVPVIINIAQKMGMNVIAEGIETAHQLAQLRQLNCDFGQGYFFSQPLNPEQAVNLLLSFPQW